MKKLTLPITLLFLFFITINTQAQVNYNANNQVNPYDGIFRPGINPGYYGGNWNDLLLTDIVGGNPAAGTEGAGVRTLRSSLPESIALIFDYPTWEGIYNYYEAMGMKDNTMIVGFAHPDHADPVQYCPGVQTDMFANLYEPIFDGGLNGTPVNENNYFARYMWDLLEGVGDHVRFWEIWNEPGFDYTGARGWLEPGQPGNWWDNNPEPCDYKLQAPIFHFVRTMRIAYQVIKTHSPDDYVVLSGVGYESFLDAVLRNTDNPNGGSPTSEFPLGGGAYFDVMGFHSYPHFDGSMREWDSSINGFRYFRHSDRGIEGFLQKRATREANLANYGYDGVTYPEKLWMITEYNVPNESFPTTDGSGVALFGSQEGARNFIMKSYVAAMQEGLIQIHPYQIAERETVANADDSFDRMGFFENLNVIEHFDQVILEQGVGYKTTTEMLFGKTYDATRTAQLNLPAGIKGAAFKNTLGQYVYALWARTNVDMSETVSGNYSFPASLNIGNLERRNWDYGETDIVVTIPSQNISLDGSVAFFTPTANTPEGEITMNCPIDSVNMVLAATLQEGGKTFSWTTPTATTTCPLGGLTITQVAGQPNGSFFAIGGDIIAYEARDNCGNIVECGFRLGVRSSGGGIGNEQTGCHASRDGFNFLGNYGGHKYFISLEAMSYTEALSVTANQGGYIASINSQGENDYLQFWNIDQAFIGLNDVAQEGNEVWQSGEPITYTNFEDNSCVWCESNTPTNDATEYHPWNGKWSWIPATDVRKVLMEVPCAETLGCGCPATNEPVCGSDGTTYLNACEAECFGIFNYSYGSCGGTTTQTYFQNCPSNITVTAPDANGATVTWDAPNIFNNCPNGYTLTPTINSGSIFTIGTTQVSYSLVSGNGCDAATGNCSFTVTVEAPNTGGCNAPQSVAGFTTLGEYGNSKYYLSNEISRPSDAQFEAAALGGYLAVITSAGENNFIQQNIPELVYIGLDDFDSEGDLEWINDEPLGYNNIDICDFCNENSEEFDFVVMAPWNGKWSFSNFYNQRLYVMEIPCSSNPGDCTTGPTTIVACNDGNPNTINDQETILDFDGSICIPCTGTINDCNTPGEPIIQPCDDGNPCTINDRETILPFDGTVCVTCRGTPVDCSTGTTSIVTCDDGNPNTINDQQTILDCNGDICVPCLGTPINNSTITLVCPPDINFTLENGATSVAVNYLDPLPTTTCIDGGININQSGPTSGAALGVGIYTVNYTVVDACNTIESCSFTITIEAGGTGGECPDDIAGFTTLGEFGNSKYYLSNDISRPTDAQAVAESNGGYLVAISSQAENDFIQQNIPEMVYIGLTDENSEGNFEWFNGETFGFDKINPCGFCNENADDMDYVIMAPWNGDWSFSNFYNNRKYVMEIPCDGNTGGSNLSVTCSMDEVIQISNGETQGIIDYDIPLASTTCPTGGLTISRSSGLPVGSQVNAGVYPIVYTITDACGNTKQCSFVVNVLPPNGGGCPNTLTGHTFVGEFGGSAYFISNEVSRPVDAQAVAESNGGNLAVINSQAENDFIWSQIDELVYIGLDDYDTENSPSWVDGSTTNFTNFDICNFCNENTEEMDFVVMHSWNGNWSWSNFYNQRKYVVEIPCTQNLNNPLHGNALIALPQENVKPMLEKLVPNPAMDYIFTQIKTSQEEAMELQVYDARGVLVKSIQTELFKGTNTVEIDISELPAGFYSVYLPKGNRAYSTMRFVKMDR